MAFFALAAGVLGCAGVGTGHVLLVVGAAAALVVSWWLRPDPDTGRWARGADGEVATAAVLARLSGRFVVLHDLRSPGGRGNIDHLVIGPSGVWVIDSKVRRARLRIRSGRVWAGDHVVDPGPVIRQAALVADALGVPVAALVAVHGEGLRRRGQRVDYARIIPVARLLRRLRRGRTLSRSEIFEIADRAHRTFSSH